MFRLSSVRNMLLEPDLVAYVEWASVEPASSKFSRQGKPNTLSEDVGQKGDVQILLNDG